MKYAKVFTVCTTAFICSISFGQNEIKKIKITEAAIQFGTFFERNKTRSVDDFREIAPQSVLLKNDLSLYSNQSVYTTNGNPTLVASVGFQFANKDKTAYRPTPLLRLSLGYTIPSYSLNCYLYNEESTPYDTLTSSQTGQQLLVDSVQHNNYSLNYKTDQLRLGISMLFRTNPEARCSVYGGVGLSFGVSINTQTNILYNSYTDLQVSNNVYPSPIYYSPSSHPVSPAIDGNTEQEVIRNNNTGYSYSASIPFGVDLRLGNKREFWKMLHVFCETRPGVNFTSIPGFQTIATASIQQTLGLRVAWQ